MDGTQKEAQRRPRADRTHYVRPFRRSDLVVVALFFAPIIAFVIAFGSIGSV